MVDLQGQYQRIKSEVQSGFNQVLESAAFINGPAVKSFCKNLESYLDVKHVIPCGNGTDALQIALMALGLKPGDEVITVSFTFVATCEVIALMGLKPVFVDIDPDTYNMDVSQLEEKITSKTKCIIPVHLYGQSTNMEPLLELAKKHNIFVVEDNAQAIGASCKVKGEWHKTGTLGDFGCTSFYPSKNLGCYGDGGALFTNNDTFAEAARCVANHGQRKKYTSDLVGINSRLDSFQAVVLNAKLNLLDEFSAERKRAAGIYDEAFKDNPALKIPERASYSSHVFHQYTLCLADSIDREYVRERLSDFGIPSMVYYPVPAHLQPAYQHYNDGEATLVNTERLAKQVISLPMHTELNAEQLTYIINSFLQAI